MSDLRLQPALSMPAAFRFDAVSSLSDSAAAATPAPSLGALAAFTGTFHGKGFNTIFRPDSPNTPTALPIPVSPTVNDNILELNLTQETLSFSPSLGAVPNRGMVQADAILNGVPYLQVINDVTTGTSVGIHFEPGLWMAVPPTADPSEGTTFVRMASIPHGTTIVAQGKAITTAGKPVFPKIDITPNFIGGGPSPFPSQTATQGGTARIPQDLTSFIKAGTITQAMLDNPVSLLSTHIADLDVISTTAITVSVIPPGPLFGGGLANIAFLLGDVQAASPNADAVAMEATFWVETVEYTLQVPVFRPGHPPLTISPVVPAGNPPVPEFTVTPPTAITAPRTIKATATQIQYAQKVFLNFNGLTWPHVSVATLVPAAPITVPASAFS
jgi:hypothetical protein